MTDSAALLRRLTRFRSDYSRRAYSLDAGDIEIVLGMGREIARLRAKLHDVYLATCKNPKNWKIQDIQSATRGFEP